MKKKLILGLLMAAFLPLTVLSQDDLSVKVTAIGSYLDSNKEQKESTNIDDGEAPLEVTFRPITENMGDHTPSYEWHFRKQGEENEFMVRYEEETMYRFVESGTFEIVLKTTLTDTGEQLDSSTVIVAISESRLEFPNAFSPNDDGHNKLYGAKGVNDPNHPKHWKNIVEFHAYIFNRQGQKLYEWHDPSGSWDGTYKGHPVKEGVYYVLVKAKGSDGRVYNIRKDVNLLRGYIETGNSNSTTP